MYRLEGTMIKKQKIFLRREVLRNSGIKKQDVLYARATGAKLQLSLTPWENEEKFAMKEAESDLAGMIAYQLPKKLIEAALLYLDSTATVLVEKDAKAVVTIYNEKIGKQLIQADIFENLTKNDPDDVYLKRLIKGGNLAKRLLISLLSDDNFQKLIDEHLERILPTINVDDFLE